MGGKKRRDGGHLIHRFADDTQPFCGGLSPAKRRGARKKERKKEEGLPRKGKEVEGKRYSSLC